MVTENSSNERIIIAIGQKLKKMGYSIDVISPKELQYIIKIEPFIQEAFDKENEVKAILSNNSISVKNLSEQAKIARQTFYNVPLLSEYVAYNTKEFEKVNISAKQNSSNAEIQRLKEEIEALHLRDIMIEELKLQLEEAQVELKRKNETIKALSSRGKVIKMTSDTFKHN